MTRIEHISTELAGIDERVYRLRELIDSPGFDQLPAVECKLLEEQFALMHRVAKTVRARLELAERMGAPDEVELLGLGLEDWLTL